MKILMINSFNYLRGGGERCFFDLSDLLRSHGHEVIPFCMDHPKNLPSEYSDYFVSYVDFPTELAKPGLSPKLSVIERVLYSREARQKVEALIARVKPDLVHIHGFIHEMSTSILPALKAAGLPVVQTLHDYKPACPNTTFVSNDRICEACKGGKYYNMTRYRCKRGSRSASMLATAEMYFHEVFRLYQPNVDRFIAPSRFMADKMIEHGIRTPLDVIPNFINPASFTAVYEPQNHFVFAGRLVRVKGILTLLEAMRHIRGDAVLNIAGAGELEPELRQFVQAHNLTNVRFLGHLDTGELARLVQTALFTVSPSEWYENYSMTVIESLASGTAVIGADIGGIPEQVRDGWNGYLFEPGNAVELAAKMQALLDDRELAIEMGRNGRSQVEALNSPETHYDQTLQVYERLRRASASPQSVGAVKPAAEAI
ncbi:MAG: glycosyltransferase family 4 protein [Candidatus Promineofilum sp.]|nr:glycosyltransferase family 4 protein [Promineifilum sp.]